MNQIKGLKAHELKVVKEILTTFFPEARVYIFGSRLNGNHKPTSDLDICLRGESSLDLVQWSKMEEAFSSSDLLFKVDVCDWYRLTQDFKNIVSTSWVELKII